MAAIPQSDSLVLASELTSHLSKLSYKTKLGPSFKMSGAAEHPLVEGGGGGREGVGGRGGEEEVRLGEELGGGVEAGEEVVGREEGS